MYKISKASVVWLDQLMLVEHHLFYVFQIIDINVGPGENIGVYQDEEDDDINNKLW